jgi:aryl-alcohol dehydrogenase-like predicted oxidoreductase
MNRRSFGQTGLQVHPICLGGNVFGWSADEGTSFKVLDAYIQSGGNFIDTADVYSRWVPGHHGGESETVLGRWLKRMGQREELVIATKVGMEVAEGKGLSRKHIHKAVEHSLNRLQVDYIDLYYAHQDDPSTDLDETLEAFDELVRQGKVRNVAASNYTAQRLERALQLAKDKSYRGYTGLQVSYNIVARSVYEGDLESLCSSEGLGVVGYSSLASGFLTGKYREDQPLPSSPRAQNVKNLHMNPHGFRVLHTLEKVAEQLGATIPQVALAWVLARQSMTGPIVSGTTPEQVHEFMKAADLRLSNEAIYLLDNASQEN